MQSTSSSTISPSLPVPCTLLTSPNPSSLLLFYLPFFLPPNLSTLQTSHSPFFSNSNHHSYTSQPAILLQLANLAPIILPQRFNEPPPFLQSLNSLRYFPGHFGIPPSLPTQPLFGPFPRTISLSHQALFHRPSQQLIL